MCPFYLSKFKLQAKQVLHQYLSYSEHSLGSRIWKNNKKKVLDLNNALQGEK
jgi:hypothetical protein